MITRKLEKFISASIRTSLAAKYGFLDRIHEYKNHIIRNENREER